MNAGKLTLGLVLLTVGILASLDTLDIWEAGRIWDYWPVLLIILGISREIDGFHRHTRESGYALIAVGVWMLFGTQHYFDLSIRRAFPIGMVVFGLGVLVHALIDRPAATAVTAAPQNEEHTHDVR